MRSKLFFLLVCSFVLCLRTSAQQCQDALDIVYVVDVSGSVTAPNFNKTLVAIQDEVQGFNIGTLDSDTHVGFVTFDSQAYYNFGLGNYTTKPSLLTAIGNVPYIGGATNIYSGMMLALDQVFGQNGDRVLVPDMMIVITDGQDNSSVGVAQAQAAARGITVWAVGVGSGFDFNQLVAVSGSASRVKNVTNFDFVNQALEGIPCPPVPCEPPTKCVDQSFECAGWAALGYCAGQPTSDLIKKQCPVSCHVCNGTCEDIGRQCAARAAAGECFQNPEDMLVKCKKSCNYCDQCINLHDGCSIFNQNYGLCSNPTNATHMHFYCRASCGDCTPTSNCSQGLDPIANKCPRDWTYIPSENACFWPTSTWQLQPAGRTICQQKGGELASIHSNTTNAFLTDFYPITMPQIPYVNVVPALPFQYFIGLLNTNPTWTSLNWTDASPVNYLRWSAAQPNTGGVSTILFTQNSTNPTWVRSYWATAPFDWNLPSFCEKPICPSPSTTTTSAPNGR